MVPLARTRSLLVSILMALTLMAGCTEDVPPETKREKNGPGPNVDRLTNKQPWEGRVSFVTVPIFGFFVQWPCHFARVCVGNDGQTQTSAWDESTNRIMINLTWEPVSGGSEELALAVRMWDYDTGRQDEIAYEEGPSPLQIVLEGDLKWRWLDIFAETPRDGGFVQEQPFTGEITHWHIDGLDHP